VAHIKDLWITREGRKTGRHPDNGGSRNSKRWKATWTDPDGTERAKCFARKIDGEQFLAMKEKLRVRAELLATDGDGIDPCGYYVYLLWEVRDADKPLYVGSSGSILARLGSHLGDGGKRSRVGWVTLIRCTSERAMQRREGELIRRYRPEWNKHIPPEMAA
jgi:hypothetical protein